jgi:chaperone modulatory protein CbpM
MILQRREFLARVSIDEQTLEVWLAEEWLIPVQSSHGEAYTEADVARAMLIHDLRNVMGVNEAGIGVALHLLDQLYCFRNAVASREGKSSH